MRTRRVAQYTHGGSLAYKSDGLICHLGLRWITQKEGAFWAARGHVVVTLLDIADHHSLWQRDILAAFVREDVCSPRAELSLPVPRSCTNLDKLCGTKAAAAPNQSGTAAHAKGRTE
jgi:hypothetical protein